MDIREVRAADYDQLIALWEQAGLALPAADLRQEIVKKRERDADLFLVIDDRGRVVSSVMGSYDGRRGWINRLAVHPDRQGHGHASDDRGRGPADGQRLPEGESAYRAGQRRGPALL